MDREALKILLKYQGDYNFFCQGDYIRNNGWDNVDARTRKGAWIGDQYNEQGEVTAYGLGRGVCTGLAAAYLISGGQWNSFKAYTNSERGKSVIRGIMNLQMIETDSQVLSGEGRHTVLKMNHVRYSRTYDIYLGPGSMNSRQVFWKELTPGIGYMICAGGPTCSHMLSMRIRDGSMTLFDPNLGEYSFPCLNGRSVGMESFLTYLSTVFYTEFTLFIAERYVLR